MSGRDGFVGLPRGSRDRVPPESRLRRRLTARLLEEFERWGYAHAMPPLLEDYDVLGRGLTPEERRQCVRFMEPSGGQMVALRSDVTPQIARMVAQRFDPEARGRILRLCYAAELVRLSDEDREHAEQHQAGVELLGDGDPAADVELIALCHASLVAIGLSSFRIDLSHQDVARAVLSRLPERLQAATRALLARKDRLGIERELTDHGVARELVTAAASLCDLYGPPSVLGEAAASLAPVVGTASLVRLEAVLAQLERVAPLAYETTDIDLGEVRGFDYYSGLRLRVWAPGVARPIVRGGRYDDLLGRYGAPAPATGFAIDLDALEAALAPFEAHAADAPGIWLMATTPGAGALVRVQAARAATHARAHGLRSWVELEPDWDAACRRADTIGAERLSFFDAARARRDARHRNGTWIDVEPWLEPAADPQAGEE